MAEFKKFDFRSLEELEARSLELGLDIPFSRDVSALFKPVKIGYLMAPNAIAVLPMEGCDSNFDGSPDELTIRRYRRFAAGGAGFLWFEACAVQPSGRANPRQMSIDEKTVGGLQKLVEIAREEADRSMGHRPLCVLQLTHSGRWSRPTDKSEPVIAQHDPILDQVARIDKDYPVFTDKQFDALMSDYVAAALLAKQAGFDGVDVKLAHRYLLSELLAAFERGGKYGGSFENRTRFGLETIERIRRLAGDNFLVGCRLSMYDAHPYPYGWGVDHGDFWKMDLTEPLKLVRELCGKGIDFMNASLGNVYYKYPYLTRPFDSNTIGGLNPHEHPLESVARIMETTSAAKKAGGDLTVIGGGYSWLRQFIFHAGAAKIERGQLDMVGMGRMSLAYPDAPKDLKKNGELNPAKVCVACSKCTQIMRDHGTTGCVVRDHETYAPIYKQYREAAEKGNK
jgi:2,4-dienoyl-CoA reductase-like NADH-dependent reductase (Old Yellow Enzyme family)